MISAEWVETVATAIPVWTSAGLVLWGQGWLWRRWLWDAHQAELRQISVEIGGPIRPRWAGWSVRGLGAGVVVEGGLRGVRSRVHARGRTHEVAGVIGGAELARILLVPPISPADPAPGP